MRHYRFAGYDFYISSSLKPVIDENSTQFLVVHPQHQTICFSVKQTEKRLRIDSFFGLRHELKDKTIYIYQSSYAEGEEIDETDDSIHI